MRRLMWALAAVATLFLIIGGFVSAASAGLPPPELEPPVLEELRDMIPTDVPETDPDLDDATMQFDMFVSTLGLADNGGGGSKLTGPCGGIAVSYDGDGVLDAAIDLGGGGPPIDILDGGVAFTSSNRFKVDTGGDVVWFGFMPRAGDGPMEHTWVFNVGGAEYDRGGSDNEDGDNTASGVVRLGDDSPLEFNLNTTVDGNLTPKDGAACVGDGHIEFIGPLFGPVGLVGLGATAAGAAGLGLAARPRMEAP